MLITISETLACTKVLARATKPSCPKRYGNSMDACKGDPNAWRSVGLLFPGCLASWHASAHGNYRGPGRPIAVENRQARHRI